MKKLALRVLPLIFLLSCKPAAISQVSSLTNEQRNHRAWMNKVARVLLYNSGGLSSEQDFVKYEKLDRRAYVQKLMEDPRFSNTILDFNLYFLGAKPDNLISSYSKSLSDSLLRAYPQAVRSAVEGFNGRDYFKLFDLKQKAVITPNIEELRFAKEQSGTINSAGTSVDTTSPSVQKKLVADAIVKLKKFSDELPKFSARIASSSEFKSGCEEYSTESQNIDEITRALGIDDLAFDALSAYCDLPGLISKEELQQYISTFKDIVRYVESNNYSDIAFSKASYASKATLVDSEIISPSIKTFALTSMGFFKFNTNSSTNFNRKRAKYMLKTYFCDDLTPISVVSKNTQHAKGKHASDAACQACHYKLDPMAGFFRYKGASGTDFETRNFLIFDDLLKIEGERLNSYYSNWKSNDNGRQWNTGHIRSTLDSQMNFYGNNLDELFGYIRKSEETKKCLVRRMSEYFVSTNQMFDGQWLEDLAQKLIQSDSTSPQTNGAAFKEVVTNLILSKTFSDPSPTSSKCYDFSESSKASSLPCEVSYIVQKNCQHCHGNGGPSKGLNLQQWRKDGNGNLNFTHIDSSTKKQVAKRETFSRLINRLSDKDENKRMPMDQDMPPTDREILYKWAQEQLKEAK